MKSSLLAVRASEAVTSALLARLVQPAPSRLFVLCLGAWADDTRNAVRSLPCVYDAIAEPRLDVVPLLPCAGWTLDAAAKIDGLWELIVPVPLGVTAAEACISLDAEVVRARHESSLPELSVRRVDMSAAVAVTAPTATAAANGDDALSSPPHLQHNGVAVGGTFDRLHAGHRLLLAVAAIVCRETLYMGVTADKLLEGKKDARLIYPYERRANEAAAYAKLVRPGLVVETSALVDPQAPPKAATLSAITALVISVETEAGGQRVAQMRREHGIDEPLELVAVGLVGAESQDAAASKLSSSALRREEARRLDV